MMLYCCVSSRHPVWKLNKSGLRTSGRWSRREWLTWRGRSRSLFICLKHQQWLNPEITLRGKQEYTHLHSHCESNAHMIYFDAHVMGLDQHCFYKVCVCVFKLSSLNVVSMNRNTIAISRNVYTEGWASTTVWKVFFIIIMIEVTNTEDKRYVKNPPSTGKTHPYWGQKHCPGSDCTLCKEISVQYSSVQLCDITKLRKRHNVVILIPKHSLWLQFKY